MVGLAFIWCDPKDLHEAYSRRKGKGKEKAYKEIDDDDEEEEEEEDEGKDEEEGEDLEQAQRGAGPSSRKGRKRQFSSGWVDREEVDEEFASCLVSASLSVISDKHRRWRWMPLLPQACPLGFTPQSWISHW